MTAPKVLVRIERTQVVYAAVPADEVDAHGSVAVDEWTAREWCEDEDSAEVVAVAARAVPKEWLGAIPYEDNRESDETITQRLDAGTLVFWKAGG